MDKGNKIMSIGNQIFLIKVINGIAWVCAGFFGFFDNIPCKILNLIALLVSIIACIKVMTSERELEDEMSIHNMTEAKAFTQTTMHLIYCLATLVLVVVTHMPISINVNWKSLIVPVFFIVLGIEDLMIGLKFQKLEEE